MFVLMMTLFILVCLVLMVVVLLQSSKGGGLAGAFGGGGSDSSVMGGRGAATFLNKVTVYLAVSFMVLALVLAIMSSRDRSESAESIIQQRAKQENLGIFNVEEGASILDQLDTGTLPTEIEEGAGETVPADGETPVEPEPVPAGN